MTGYDRITATSFGGPEVLALEHVADLPEPGEGEVRLRVEAAGVGYTDTILRRGRYALYTGGLPLTPGYDVVGIVDKLGAGVTTIGVGDRVADMPVSGGYSQYMIRLASGLVRVPAGVDPAAAVEVPLMWVTAWQMLTRITRIPQGSTILVVGASGSVGRALVLLGRHRGLRVIGTCSARNLSLVERLGAISIDYRRPDLLEAIRLASGGDGVVAAFDAIGGASWETSWRALASCGILVAYGFQDFLDFGGKPDEAQDAMLKLNQIWPALGLQDGSNRQTTFYDINVRRSSHPGEYRDDASHLLDLMAQDAVLPAEAELLPLSQAAQAHRRIASGALPRRLVLCP